MNLGSLGSLLVELGASTVMLQSDMNRGVQMTARAVTDINMQLDRIGVGVNTSGLQRTMDGIATSVGRVTQMIGGMLAGELLGGGVRHITDMADEWMNVENRIKLTVSTMDQLHAAEDKVFKVAQDTGTEIESNAKLYSRLDQVIVGTGKSQAEAAALSLRLTRALNEDIVLTGVSAGEASRSIMDLAHGLAGGVMHAQQLRPIMRQFPDLAKQIADGLGVSAKQLEEMVHAGLPAVDVLRALDKQADGIHAKFLELGKTWGRVWTELSNAVTRYIGEAMQTSTVMQALKDGVSTLAAHINDVGKAAEIAGGLMVAWLGGKVIGLIGPTLAALRDMTLAQGAYATTAQKTAAAELVLAEASQKSLAASFAKTIAVNEERLATLAAQEAKVAALTAERDAIQKTAATFTLWGEEVKRLTTVQKQLAAANLEVAATTKALDAGFAKQESQEAQLIATNTRLAASTAALATANAEATGVMGLLSRGATGFMSLIGGWPTLVFAAGAALAYFMSQSTEAEKGVEQLTAVVETLGRAQGRLTEEMEANARQQMAQKEVMLASLQAQYDLAKATADTTYETDAMGTGWADAAIQAGHSKQEVDSLKAALDLLRNAMDEAKRAQTALAMNQDIIDAFHAHQESVAGYISSLKSEEEHIQAQVEAYGKSNAAIIRNRAEHQILKLQIDETTEAGKAEAAAIRSASESAARAALEFDGLKKSTRDHGQEANHAASLIRAEDAAMDSLADTIEKLRGEISGPAGKALAEYNLALSKLQQQAEDAAIKGGDVAKIIALWQQGEALAAQRLEQTTVKLREQSDAFANLSRQLEISRQVFAAPVEQQEALRAALERYDQAMMDHKDLLGNVIYNEDQLRKALDGQIPEYQRLQQAIHDLNAEQAKQKEVMSDVSNIVQNGLTSSFGVLNKILTGEIHNVKDFAAAVKDTFKSLVMSIIEEFEKLAIINPIMNAIFGSAMGTRPTLANTSGGLLQMFLGGGAAAANGSGGGSGGGGSGSFLGSLAEAYASGGTASGGGGIMSLLNSGSTMYSGAQRLMSWLGIGGGGAAAAGTPWLMATGPGASAYGGSVSSAVGITDWGGYSGSAAPANSGMGFGQVASIAGAALAGYSAYRGAGGGAAGVGAGAAYGVGTYFAGSALAAGAGAMAGGATLGGAAAAGMAAIPVIGWIALAAMAINMISGGKLFGTAWKPVGSKQSVDVDGSGVDMTAVLHMEKQGALFSGKKKKDKSVAIDDETAAAWDAWFAKMDQATTDFAESFGIKMGATASGTFDEEFDKHGKSKGTVTTIDGKTYKGETAEQFAERMQASNILKVLDKLGLGASDFVKGLLGDADALAAGVQDFAKTASLIQTDIGNGAYLLNDTGHTLVSAMEAVKSANTGGEELLATYQRLAQATQAYLQTMQQVDAALAKYQQGGSQFDNAMVSLVNQTAQFTKALNDSAKAAGLAAAKAEDLAKVQELMSLQAQEQRAMLVADAMQLKAAIWGTSYDQRINSDVTQANDLQKTIDKLMADPMGAFKGLQALIDKQKALMQDAADADAAQKAEQLKFQHLGQAQNLAKDIADIAFADGATIADVLKQLDIDPDKLAKELGMDREHLDKYLDTLERQSEFYVQQMTQGDLQTGYLRDIRSILAQTAGMTIVDTTQNGATNDKDPGHLRPAKDFVPLGSGTFGKNAQTDFGRPTVTKTAHAEQQEEIAEKTAVTLDKIAELMQSLVDLARSDAGGTHDGLVSIGEGLGMLAMKLGLPKPAPRIYARPPV